MPHPTWFGRIEWFRRHRYGVPDAPRAEDQELLMRAADRSRYAACPEVLLGYRQGAYSVSRTLEGRFGRAGAYTRHARSLGDPLGAFRAILVAFAKGGIDILAGLPGCDALFFARMAQPPSRAQQDEWEAVWRRLAGEVG